MVVEPFVYSDKSYHYTCLQRNDLMYSIREGLALLRSTIESAGFFLDLAVKCFPGRLHNIGG